MKIEGDLSRLQIYDVTLRDGFQKAGIAKQTVDKKRRIADALDHFGVDFIEGGWPGSTAVDTEFFRQMQGQMLDHATLVAFGSTARIRVNPEDDKNIQDLLESQARCITLVGKSSLRQVTDALGATGLDNIDTVVRSIEYLKRHGRTVFLDAEHFFDGFKENRRYSLEVLFAAKEAGADGIALCDTKGGSMPDEIYKITKTVKRKIGDLPIGIHTHNDSETAVTNTLKAVQAGASLVQGTINGYGERVGNANLCSLIPDLIFKYGYKLAVDMVGLTNLANYIASEARIPLPDDAPYVGRYAFAHKGGLHVSAISKDPSLYEHIQPEWVGNKRVIINSEYGGKANVRETAKRYGFVLTNKDARLLTQKMEEMGELGDAQNYLMLYRYFGRPEPFEILRREYVDIYGIKRAILELKIKDNIDLVVSNGTGPLNAFDNALKKGIDMVFPEVNYIRLVNYDLYVPKNNDFERYGTDAQVTVSITLASNGDTWTSCARGEDQDNAARNALTDGYKFWLCKKISI